MKRIVNSLISLVMAVTMAFSGMSACITVQAEEDTEGTSYVAEYDGTQYATLKEALDAAGNAGTITLLSDAVIPYEQRTVSSGLTLVSDANGPYTLTIEEQGENTVVSPLFNATGGSGLILQDVNVDAAGFASVFVGGEYHLQITGQVTMSNFTKKIKENHRFQVNSGATLTVQDCKTTDDYLFDVKKWARVTGKIVNLRSSAKLGVLGFIEYNSSWIDQITSDGAGCDIYISTTNTFGDKSVVFGGDVNVTLAESCSMAFNKTPTFETDDTTLTLTYGDLNAVYEDDITLISGGKLSDDMLKHFVVANAGYQLAIVDGNLVMQSTSATEKMVTYAKLDNSTGTITDSSGGLSGAEKAWDGNTSTYPDLKNSSGYDSGTGWTMIQYPDAQKIAMIKYCPRTNYTSRAVGCSFEASTDGESFVPLGSIDVEPTAGVYTEIPVYDATEYQYVRFNAAAGSYMNISDIQVYTYQSVSNDALGIALEELQGLADAAGCDITAERETVNAAIASDDAEDNIDAYVIVYEKISELKQAVKYDSFAPNSVWTDTEGVFIQAHGGAVMWDPVSEKYYWYGEHKGTDNYTEGTNTVNGTPVIGTSVYSSKDLYNWKNEGVALPVFNNPVFTDPNGVITDDTPMYLNESSEEFQTAYESAKTNTESLSTEEEVVTYNSYTGYYTFEQYNKHDLDEINGLYDDLSAAEKAELYTILNYDMVMERPKVVYNPNNNTYVMWFHLDGPGVGKYEWADGGVAVSDSPTGPFKYLGKADLTVGKENIISTGGSTDMLRDMTLFVDDDGTGYVIHSDEENATLYIEELTDDYTGVTGNFSRNYVRRNDTYRDSREAPAIAKYNGKYYLVTSGCTGWPANAAGISVADTLIIDYTDKTCEDAVQHIGPFQHVKEVLTNPAIGPNSSKTFNGQSTCIFPVQGKEGCFIYMGDKWSAGSLKDSRYQWLPVVIDEGNATLGINWADEWKIDDFDTIASNRKDLNTLIQKCRDIDDTVYTSDSVSALDSVVSTAEEVAYNADEVTIAATITTLQASYDSLIKTSAVALYNSVEYDSFADAYEAFVVADADGTITLLNDAVIPYQTYTLAKNLTITSNSAGPHTLTIEEQGDNEAISTLFDTSNSYWLTLKNVNVDGTGFGATFLSGAWHLQITEQVTMTNFTKQIKKGNRMQVNSGAVLTLENCNTQDDCLIEVLEAGRITGKINIVNSSAKKGVISYNYSKSSWFDKVATDGNNDCDIYIGAGNTFGSSGLQFEGPVKITIASGQVMNINKIPNFVGSDSSVTLSYEGTLAVDTVLVQGNGYLTAELAEKILFSSDEYELALNSDGNLVITEKLEDDLLVSSVGAQIRMTGDEGFRFLSKVNRSSTEIAALKADGTIKEYGTLIMPAVVLGENELTMDAAITGIVYENYTVKAAKVASTVHYEEATDSTKYAALLVGFPANNATFYKTYFTVRTYVVMGDGSIVYGDAVNRSMYDVAIGLGETYAGEENVAKILEAVESVSE
ncbi:MAG: glycoside hydrolase family 43 protein [Lachnospiraceae bacterium]